MSIATYSAGPAHSTQLHSGKLIPKPDSMEPIDDAHQEEHRAGKFFNKYLELCLWVLTIVI